MKIILLISFLFSFIISCPFLRGNKKIKENITPSLKRKLSSINLNDISFIPGNCSLTGGISVTKPTKQNICQVYSITLNSFQSYISNLNLMEKSQLYGAAVRLAFHDAGKYDQFWIDEFGPDGCLSKFPENAGLIEPDGIVNTIIESMWQNVCDKISRADFWVLFAKLVIEEADPTHKISIPFHYGRIDAQTCDGGAFRLPGGQLGIDEFQRVFVFQMGLTLHDAITLLGAHTLGHVHPQFSGYGRVTNLNNITANSWDPTPYAFDNQYYKMLQRVSLLFYLI